MRITDLAPALLALGDLVAETHRVVYPGFPSLEVDIRSTREGSFVVDMLAMLADEAGGLLLSETATSISNTVAIVTGGHGIFDYLRTLSGRRVVGEELVGQADDGTGIIRVTLDDGATVDAPADVVRAGNSIEIRRHAKGVVQPLRRDGIDDVGFQADEVETTVRIGRDDLSAFEVPEGELEESLEPITTEVVLRPRSISLEDDGPWRVVDGQGRPFRVVFEDEAFVRGVQSKQHPVGLGDRLVVRLRTEPGAGRKWDHHYVEEVLDHLPAPAPDPQLGFDEPD